ncbi:MAG: hypothetical protein KIS96_00085 [Bauldia sp.]|nr:hypothetical protein [Bauldia sp.]
MTARWTGNEAEALKWADPAALHRAQSQRRHRRARAWSVALLSLAVAAILVFVALGPPEAARPPSTAEAAAAE